MIRRAWDWLRRAIGLVRLVPHDALTPHRFHVVLATDRGAVARQAFEALTPGVDGRVLFWDGAECRGEKR